MTRREQLMDAFQAYNKSVMTDAQLKIAYDATAEMVETLNAMGVSGIAILGFIMQEQSLRGYIDARKRG